MVNHAEEIRRKRPVSLTIRADLLEEANSLNLNASAAAEKGIESAVKAAKEQQWVRSAGKAIEAHNARAAERGTLLTPSWGGGDGAV